MTGRRRIVDVVTYVEIIAKTERVMLHKRLGCEVHSKRRRWWLEDRPVHSRRRRCGLRARIEPAVATTKLHTAAENVNTSRAIHFPLRYALYWR